MSLAAPASPASALKCDRMESWFGRVLTVLSVIAAIGMCSRFAVLLWARNEFTQPESVVAAQSMMLARDGTLYYDLNSYPHTVAAYTPILYWLEAAGSKLGMPTFLVGRLLSFSAMLGLFALVWRLLMLYTGDRRYAWTGAVLGGSSALLSYWCSVGQTDTLAIFFAVAAFYHFSRYYIRGEADEFGPVHSLSRRFSRSKRRSLLQPRFSSCFGSVGLSWRSSLAHPSAGLF